MHQNCYDGDRLFSSGLKTRNRNMTIARVIQAGDHQTIELPQEFHFDSDEVEVFRRGNEVILRQKPKNAATIFDLLSILPEDFMSDGRSDEEPQSREDFS